MDEFDISNAAPKGWYSRGYLPHLDAVSVTQHVCFHLADSLPRSALDRMEAELRSAPTKTRDDERRRRIHELLDRGIGACILAKPECAQVVRDALLFGAGSRYRLLAWVVMPNHVHVLFEPRPEWPTAKLVQSWKRHTTREIHQLMALANERREIWQRDYWDRFIRDNQHFETTRFYIENNPVAARLVASAENWRWSSAYPGHQSTGMGADE